MEEASYGLLDAVSGIKLNGGKYIAIEGSMAFVICVFFKKLNLTAFYLSFSADLSTMYTPLLLRISKWQYGPDLFPFGCINETQLMHSLFHINHNARHKQKTKNVDCHGMIKALFTGEKKLTRSKVSANHIQYVTFRELAVFQFEEVIEKAWFVFPVINKLAGYDDIHEAFAVGLILWAMLIPDDIRTWVQVSDIWNWNFTSTSDFAQKIKSRFSLKLKAVQNLVQIDLTKMFELEVLVNRGVGEVDWDKEKNNRINPNLADFNSHKVYQEAKALFLRAKSTNKKPKKLEWEDYWSERWQWAPTGAFHSQYDEDTVFQNPERIGRNKLDSFCRMPKYKPEHFLMRKPQIRAWSSTKYEWTKQRAIYGVDATNFIIAGFAMGDCERVLSRIFPIGESATDTVVRRTVKEILRNGVPLCFDFEDFNSQHSLENMQAVLVAYKVVFQDSWSSAQLKAIDWTIASLNDVSVLGAEGEWYNTHGTLLSGWRLTTFINTVLNYVYVQLMGGDKLATTHNGDDVLAAVTNFKQVKDLSKQAVIHNVRFQKQKCFLGAVAEFLRIDHRNDQSGQYLARAVSTIIHGPTETAVPTGVLPLYKATLTRIGEAKSRGGDSSVLDRLEKEIVKYMAEKWHTNEQDITAYANTHVLLGGDTDVINEDTLSRTIITQSVQNKEANNKKGTDRGMIYPGAYDYARAVSRKVFKGLYFTRILEAVNRSLAMNSCQIKFRHKVIQREVLAIDYLNANQVNTLKSDASHTKVMMAKACGVPILTLYSDNYLLSNMLGSEKDLEKALAIMV